MLRCTPRLHFYKRVRVTLRLTAVKANRKAVLRPLAPPTLSPSPLGRGGGSPNGEVDQARSEGRGEVRRASRGLGATSGGAPRPGPMYKWLLGALCALFAAARRPAPPPAPSPRKRPLPSSQPPVEDAGDAPSKKRKKADIFSKLRKRIEAASVKCPTKARSKHQKTSVGNATPTTQAAEQAQSYSSGHPCQTPTSSTRDVEMLQVDMPCGTTCLKTDRLSHSLSTVRSLSKTKSGKHHLIPGPENTFTLRPPIKEHSVPESFTSEAGKMGRIFCTVEEDVRREEKIKYKQLLEMVKEKYPRSRPSPQSTNFNTIQVCSKEAATPVSLEGQRYGGDVSRCGTPTPGLKRADVSSPQWPLRSDKISYYMPSENTNEQARSVKPAVAGAMEKEVAAAFDDGKPEDILSSAFKLNVTREDIRSLRTSCWLNDVVINFYVNLLIERSKKEGYPSVHAFSTFFYPKLLSGGHKAVGRWTKHVELFKKDLIFVPIHLRSHWTLVVIDMRKKNISYFDSMGQKGDDICETVFQYLQEESRVKRNVELPISEWTLHSMGPREIPQQRNGSDCGVFMCKYADYISQDKRINFTQSHMSYFRMKMAWEIIHQQLL
ncbi:sentrin-specific protease 2 isoform X2 [Heliangelus exortis]|uniref:sentrin-specific protease 2 isoform X2 n=1 Tax=Heliangelus exortis TaxID=472823 RepID=UPI003A8D1976